MLTKEELLDILKDSKVDMGINPGRKFDYLLANKLLPEGVINKLNKRQLLYPDWTPELIRQIRSLQDKNKTVEEIKVLLFEYDSHPSLFSQEETTFKARYLSSKRISENFIIAAQIRQETIVFSLYEVKIDGNSIVRDWFLPGDKQEPKETKEMSFGEYGEMVKKLLIIKLKTEQFPKGGDWPLIVDLEDIYEELFGEK